MDHMSPRPGMPTGHKLHWVFSVLLLGATLASLYTEPLSGRRHWSWISIVLSLGSHLGNLDRRWWLHALTAAAVSPLVYRIFWPLYDLCTVHEVEDEASEAFFNAVSLVLGTTLKYSGVFDSVASAFAPRNTFPMTLTASSTSEPRLNEPREQSLSLIFHSAKRPSWLFKIKPPPLKLSMYTVPDPDDPSDFFRIKAEEKRMGVVTWRELRNQPEKEHSNFRVQPVHTTETPADFEEGYEDVDIDPLTLQWARIDRTPPTPLSAARLEHFVASGGPSLPVMEVQVMTAWRPLGEWLCNPAVDGEQKWSKVRETVYDWWKTCNRLRTKRIGRYSIGTFAETTDIVLGPMHLSMHDVRDFFDVELHDQCRFKAPSRQLERFGRRYTEALKHINAELVQLASDYPQNYLIGTMANLAAKIRRTAERWKEDLEFFANERSIARKRGGHLNPTHKLPAARSSSADEASGVVQLSQKVLDQRMEPWASIFPETYKLQYGRGRRNRQAIRSSDQTEDLGDRSRPSKLHKRQGKDGADHILADSGHEAPSNEKPLNKKRNKRFFGDTNLHVEKTRSVRRDGKKEFGRAWQERLKEREAIQALEDGKLIGFERQLALNLQAMRLMQKGTTATVNLDALEMDQSMAFADGEEVLLSFAPPINQNAEIDAQDVHQPSGPPESPSANDQKMGNDTGASAVTGGAGNQSLSRPKLPAKGRKAKTAKGRPIPPPAPTVQNTEDSDEEL